MSKTKADLAWLSKLESDFGSVEYVRFDQNPTRPESILDKQTVYISPGGTVDVIAATGSLMGLDRVSYSPGLRAQRKTSGGLITYRFQVNQTVPPGTFYSVQAPDMSFRIQVT